MKTNKRHKIKYGTNVINKNKERTMKALVIIFGIGFIFAACGDENST